MHVLPQDVDEEQALGALRDLQLDESQNIPTGDAIILKDHPWTKLPPELLDELFKQAISDPEPLSPLQLGSVCRVWRHIVFTTPELWSRVDLRLHSPPFHAQIELLEQWLERALHYPLSLNISCTLEFGSQQVHYRNFEVNRLMNVLGEKSSQVLSLTLNFPAHLFAGLSKSGTTWSSLSDLSVSAPNHQSLDFEPSPMRVFEKSLLLRKVTIHRFYISAFSLPWTHLLHLEIRVVAPFEICDALDWCPNLQTLSTTDVVDVDDTAPLTLPSIDHFKLERLTFSAKHYEDASYYCTVEAFDRLRLINLKALELNFAGRSVDIALDPFLLCPLFSRSNFQLQELTIHSTRLSQSDLITFLRLSPLLRRLSLTENHWTDCDPLGPEMFELMTVSPGRDSILLRLESLVFLQESFLDHNGVSFSPKVIVDLLESRWGTPRFPFKSSPLQSIVFSAIGPFWEITMVHKSNFTSWVDLGYSLSIS